MKRKKRKGEGGDQPLGTGAVKEEAGWGDNREVERERNRQ